MKRKALLIGTLCAAMSFAAQAGAQSAEEEQKMCEKVAGLKFAINDFRNLSSSATVEDTEKAAKRVSDSLGELRKAAEKARPGQTERLTKAVEELRKAVDDAPDDATLGQIESNIASKREQVQQAYQAFEQSIECPGLTGPGGAEQPRSAPPPQDGPM